MSEAEIITVALGNYSTLIAAQFFNGSTKYDVEHNTLFMERRTGSSVPRLVILDHPHAAQLRDCSYPLQDDPIEEPTNNNNSAAAGGDGDKWRYNPEEENAEFEEPYWDQDDGNEEEDDPHHHHHHHDPNRYDEKAEEEEEEAKDAVRRRKSRGAPKTAAHSSNAANVDQVNAKAIFNVVDGVTPWHQYIATGLHSRSYTLMRSLHGDSRALHSFGYGVAKLHERHSVEFEATCDATRHMLEASHHPQGIQLFSDGDGAFGGAAVNLCEYVHDEWGSKFPLYAIPTTEPTSFIEGKVVPSADGLFDEAAARLREDEVLLNLGLSTHLLSRSGTLYCPMSVPDWSILRKASGAPEVALDDAVAIAQIIASTWDTALYGLRDSSSIVGVSAFGSMGQLERLLRPAPSLRVCSAFTALPLRVRTAQVQQEPTLQDVLEGNPLMVRTHPTTFGKTSFVPLTHAVFDEANVSAGRVLAHSVSLRGVADLADRTTCPREEALRRYLAPMETSSYQMTLTAQSYPISSTFPSSAVFPVPPPSGESGAATFPRSAAEILQSVETGSHLACTYSAARMLGSVTKNFDNVWKTRRHLHRDAYLMEDDQFRDASEDLHELYDDYNHREAD